MPNRTIYLSDDLDELSRQAGLNLSQLTQQAIRQFVADNSAEMTELQIEAASKRARALDLTWPTGGLATQRSESGER